MVGFASGLASAFVYFFSKEVSLVPAFLSHFGILGLSEAPSNLDCRQGIFRLFFDLDWATAGKLFSSTMELKEHIVETLQKELERLAGGTGHFGRLEDALVLLAGGLLLLFGRKLYWCILALAGFVAGAWIGREVFPPEPVWLLIGLAIFLGVVAAVLGIFLQRLALRVTGIITGGLLGYILVESFFPVKPWPLVGMALGCLLGFWLVLWLFDWALILLSSFSGAALIVSRLPLEFAPLFVIALILALLGLAVQSGMQKKSVGKRESKPA